MNKETIELVLADSCAGPDGKGMRCNTDVVFYRVNGGDWIKTDYRSVARVMNAILKEID